MNIQDYEEELTKKEQKAEQDPLFVPVQAQEDFYPLMRGLEEQLFQANRIEFPREYMGQWERERVPYAIRHQPARQTGRTTRMILGAIHELSEGRNILIVTLNGGMTNYIKRKVEDILDSLGMREFRDRIRYTIMMENGEHYGQRGLDNTRIYYDHTCNEP